MPIKTEVKKWIPHLGIGVWLQALPLLVMFSILWFTAQDTLGLLTGTVKFWEYVIYGWAYAVSGYWLGLVVCLRYRRRRSCLRPKVEAADLREEPLFMAFSAFS